MIDVPLSVNNRTELLLAIMKKTCTEHSNNLEELGLFHTINEVCICSKMCLNNFCTPDIVNYVYSIRETKKSEKEIMIIIIGQFGFGKQLKNPRKRVKYIACIYTVN